MSRLKWSIAVATGWLVTGCAGAPEENAAAGPAPEPAQAASTSTAETGAATLSASAETVAAAVTAETPLLVIDAGQLAPSPNEGVVCREMLKPNSNMIVTACGTPAAWKKYEAREAQNAAALTRMLQGGAYR